MKRTSVLLKFALIGMCVCSVEGNFTNDHLEIVLSSLRFFNIRKCILSFDIIDETTSNVVKKFNKNFISTGVVGVEFLEVYVKDEQPPDTPTAIVIKTQAISQVKRVFVTNSEKLYWFVWFLITEDELDPEIRIPYNSQLFQIKKDSHRTYRLIENYHIKDSATFRGEFGFWTPENGLSTSSLQMYNRRIDMRGVQLNITLCKRYKVEEMIKIFWYDLARVLNFSLKTEPQKLKKTINGYIPLQNPDGSTCIWGITGLDFEKDWIYSSAGERVKLIMKFRGTNEVGWRAYVQPFTAELWLAVGIWLILSTVAIVTVNGCTRKSLYLNIFTALFCLCNSDPKAVNPPEEPLPPPKKLVYLMAVTVPTVLVPAYSAYILSTLSIIRPLEPFTDLRTFIADGTYRLTTVNNTFAVRYLRESRDPEIKYIYDNLFVGADSAAPSFSVLFEQLCKNNQLVGLFIDSKVFRPFFRCRMFIAEQEVISISTGILLAKGSPLRKMLNERLTQYHERGVKTRVRTKAVDSNKPRERETDKLNALDMSQMRAIFFLVPLGVILSLTVLASEFAVKRLCHGSPTGVSFGLGLA